VAKLTPSVASEIEAASFDFHCDAATVIAGWMAGITPAGTLVLQGHYTMARSIPRESTAVARIDSSAIICGNTPSPSDKFFVRIFC
jgi:hypothetical protein